MVLHSSERLLLSFWNMVLSYSITSLLLYSIILDYFYSQVNCSDTVYKGICQLFQVMERFLSECQKRPDFVEGHYIPFGVFSLYNDSCLSDLLSMYLQIVIRTPFNQLSVIKPKSSHFQQLPKYENSVFVFLELLFADHLATVSSIETTAFISIMDSVCNGVASFSEI